MSKRQPRQPRRRQVFVPSPAELPLVTLERPEGQESGHGCAACRSIERRQEVTGEFVRTGHAMQLLASKRAARIRCGDCGAEWELRFTADPSGQTMVHFTPANLS